MRINGNVKIITIISISIFVLIMLSVFAPVKNNTLAQELATSESKEKNNKDISIITSAPEYLRSNTEISTLDKFASDSTHYRFLGERTINHFDLALPANVTVLNATMSMVGRTPDPINKYTIGERPPFISGSDFNADGNLDLLAIDKGENKFSVLFGDGSIHFNSIIDYPTGEGPSWGTIGDLNNDGYPDIATANEAGNTITTYQNNGTGDGKFQNKKSYELGDMPRSITSADLNNDGWLDLATITNNDYQLWINYNQKNTTIEFSEAVNISIDKSPVGITSSDLNKDGLPDLVIISVGGNLIIEGKRYSDIVSIYINDGEGKFKPKQDFAVGKKPSGVITDDFNNDGWPDIATSNRAGNNVSVLLNKGNGTFNEPINYQLNDHAKSGISLKSGDIDGDGDKDIMSICGLMNFISVLRNHGDGTFAAYEDYPGGHSPNDLFLGDLDNDGDLDVATSNQHDGSVSIIPNNGNGTFSTYEFYYVGGWPRAITYGDIDNDNDNDLITANYLGGSLSIRYNDGNGYFPRRFDKFIAVEPFAPIVADIDKDGHLDLVSADEGLFEIVVVYNDGDGNFFDKHKQKVSYDIGGYPYSLLYHDFNGDGEPDLVSSNNGQQSISILMNQGNGSFAPFVDYPFVHEHPFGLGTGDMDGDGDPDIIATNLGFETDPENNVSILWNDGNGTFSNHTNYQVGYDPISVRPVDIDKDGDLDLVVANMISNSTSILFNENNETFGNRRDYPVGPSPRCVDVADLNQDGYLDIITANHENDSVSILYNLGDGSFTGHNEFIIGAQPTFVTITDLNNDGSLDIATSNLLTNSISVRLDFFVPSGISIKIGDTNPVHYTHPGALTSSVDIPDFSAQLNKYLSEHGSESEAIVDVGEGPAILIPIKVQATSVGTLEFYDLKIEYISSHDSDKDGIPDGIDTDDDNDGLPDAWELDYELDPYNPGDAGLDLDDDKLSNLEEYKNNTSPIDEDTDDDGFNDNIELDEGFDPNDPDSHPKDKSGSDDVCFTPGFGTELAISSIIIIVVLIVARRRRHGNR